MESCSLNYEAPSTSLQCFFFAFLTLFTSVSSLPIMPDPARFLFSLVFLLIYFVVFPSLSSERCLSLLCIHFPLDSRSHNSNQLLFSFSLSHHQRRDCDTFTATRFLLSTISRQSQQQRTADFSI